MQVVYLVAPVGAWESEMGGEKEVNTESSKERVSTVSNWASVLLETVWGAL